MYEPRRMAGGRWHKLSRDGVQLLCLEYGGSGSPTVLLLHGLAGYAAEWAETARWLTDHHRVLAPEQRGHGRSERAPMDVSRSAFVGDAEAWLEELDLAPVVVVGQSLGGHTAFLLAAKRPDLVRGVVVAEATPEADPDAPSVVRGWLESWPVPFPSRARAVEFFRGDTDWARVWADGLEERSDGLWPAFDIDVMVAALDEGSRTSYWEAWDAIRCPTLVVRAAGGAGRDAYQRMVASHSHAHLAEIADAGHDLHLDQPRRWQSALERFLEELEP
jgi:pimeloyl-ACP methyl ester carboxylesterase